LNKKLIVYTVKVWMNDTSIKHSGNASYRQYSNSTDPDHLREERVGVGAGAGERNDPNNVRTCE
jgi:hypothetical protein